MKFLFLQPGFSYTFGSDVSLGLYSETAYNWNTDQWTAPINASVSTLIAPGGQNIVVTWPGLITPNVVCMILSVAHS